MIIRFDKSCFFQLTEAGRCGPRGFSVRSPVDKEQRRYRVCGGTSNGGRASQGESEQFQPCNDGPCPGQCWIAHRNVAVVSHAQYVPTLTAAAA